VPLSAAEAQELAQRLQDLGIQGERHPPAMMKAVDR
jgi:hypothetical protein